MNMDQNLFQNMNMNQNLFQNMNMNQNLFQNMNMNQNLPQNMNMNQKLPQNMNINQNINKSQNRPIDMKIIMLQNINQNYRFPNQMNINQINMIQHNLNNNIMMFNMKNNLNRKRMDYIFEKKILPENIQNEDNDIIYFDLIRNLMAPNIDKTVCKIITKAKTGTGFFCKVPEFSIKLLITNNHVINKTFLNNENKLCYSITDIKNEIFKEINLKKTDLN